MPISMDFIENITSELSPHLKWRQSIIATLKQPSGHIHQAPKELRQQHQRQAFVPLPEGLAFVPPRPGLYKRVRGDPLKIGTARTHAPLVHRVPRVGRETRGRVRGGPERVLERDIEIWLVVTCCEGRLAVEVTAGGDGGRGSHGERRGLAVSGV